MTQQSVESPDLQDLDQILLTLALEIEQRIPGDEDLQNLVSEARKQLREYEQTQDPNHDGVPAELSRPPT